MIGYKKEVAQEVVSTQEVRIDFDQFLKEGEQSVKLRGYTFAIEILKEYMNVHHIPLLKGEKRDEKYMEKFRKIRERYFEPI